jgi:hypothetical protein
MQTKSNHLIQALRHELQAYGEMLLRLTRHRQWLTHPAGDDFCEAARQVRLQGEVMQNARRQQQQAQQAEAVRLGLESDAPIEKIIPLLPVNDHGLLLALARANHELLAMVLQTLQRHLRLLASSVAWTQHDHNCVRNVRLNKTAKPPAVRIPILEFVPPVCFPVEIVKSPVAGVSLHATGRAVRILSGPPGRFWQTLQSRH